MKIVVIGPQHPDSLPKCSAETFRALGNEVLTVDERKVLKVSLDKDLSRGKMKKWSILKLRLADYAMKIFPNFENKIYNRIADLSADFQPDLVITHSTWVPPESLLRLKKNTNAKIVCWFPDHPGNLGRQYLLSGCYDYLFFKDKYLVSMAKRINQNAAYLPECCEPKWHKRITLSEEELKKYTCDVTIAGNLYYYRAKIFEELSKYCDVKIWGPPIPRWLKTNLNKFHQNQLVTEEEKAKAFSGAKIVINTFQGEVEGINLRTFEAAGCGAFQICEYREEIEKLFIPGEEIETFRNLDELNEKVKFYLANPEKRKEIADKGYKRAHEDHTYTKRITELLSIIKEL
tara:strand:- start:1553 stop:2590 length:1038 start_codon:yes stop_codon:yes gene_type:complete